MSVPLINTRNDAVVIRDVAPRDGLQAEAAQTIAHRIELIEGLIAAGVRMIEIASFMREDLVPSMAHAEDVVAGIPARNDLTRIGLVANVKGAQRAVASGIDAISITVSLSDTYSRKNTGRSLDESVQALGDVVKIAVAANRPVDVVISCAFGSPFDDVTMEHDLEPFTRRIRAIGSASECFTVTLADTTGVATPALIRGALQRIGIDVGLHLHDTRGIALLNAFTGLEMGVRRFDTSVGGIGGSPFAPNSSGNLATESLVSLLHAEEFTTGIDLDVLVGVGVRLQQILGHRLPSPLVQLSSN